MALGIYAYTTSNSFERIPHPSASPSVQLFAAWFRFVEKDATTQQTRHHKMIDQQDRVQQEQRSKLYLVLLGLIRR